MENNLLETFLLPPPSMSTSLCFGCAWRHDFLRPIPASWVFLGGQDTEVLIYMVRLRICTQVFSAIHSESVIVLESRYWKKLFHFYHFVWGWSTSPLSVISHPHFLYFRVFKKWGQGQRVVSIAPLKVFRNPKILAHRFQLLPLEMQL